MSLSIPIIKSFVSGAALSTLIAQRYGIRDPQVRLIQATMRDVYHVLDGNTSYIGVLYRHIPNAYNAITAEVALLNFLHENDWRVEPAIVDNNGNTLQLIDAPEGERYFVLYGYVKGDPLGRQPSKKDAQAYGELLAAFHSTTANFPEQGARPVYDTHHLLARSFADLSENLFDHLDLLKQLRAAQTRIEPALNSLDAYNYDYGVIHGDIIPSNVLINGRGHQTLIDYDLFGYGWRMYDVASFLNEAIYWQMGEKVEQAFIKGYQQVRPISNEDQRTISLLGAARIIYSMSVAAAHVNTWGSKPYLLPDTLEGMLRVLRVNLQRLA